MQQCVGQFIISEPKQSSGKRRSRLLDRQRGTAGQPTQNCTQQHRHFVPVLKRSSSELATATLTDMRTGYLVPDTDELSARFDYR